MKNPTTQARSSAQLKRARAAFTRQVEDWVNRLGQTRTGFARIAGVSRATLSSWGAAATKYYAATPHPVTLREMADSLDHYAGTVRGVAEELRQAAEERA